VTNLPCVQKNQDQSRERRRELQKGLLFIEGEGQKNGTLSCAGDYRTLFPQIQIGDSYWGVEEEKKKKTSRGDDSMGNCNFPLIEGVSLIESCRWDANFREVKKKID